MAKLPPDNILYPGRGIRVRGSGYSAVRRGTLYFARAPRRLNGSYSPEDLERQAYFAALARSAGYMSPSQQLTARELARRSNFAVRDYLVSILAGRLIHFQRPDGSKVFSVASRNDVSNLLDAIWQLKGGILIRGEDWWQGLTPAPAGHVLTSMGEDQLPAYQPAQGGGASGLSVQMNSSGVYSASNFNCKGFTWIPDADVRVHEIWLRWAATAGDVVKAVLGQVTNHVTGGALITATQSDPYTAPLTFAPDWAHMRFPGGVLCNAGTPYFVGAFRPAFSATSPLPVNGFIDGVRNVASPGIWHIAGHIQSSNPVVGSIVVSEGGCGATGFGIQWSEIA